MRSKNYTIEEYEKRLKSLNAFALILYCSFAALLFILIVMKNLNWFYYAFDIVLLLSSGVATLHYESMKDAIQIVKDRERRRKAYHTLDNQF